MQIKSEVMNVYFEEKALERNAKDLIPFVATHPGSILKEELEARGITQKEFAKRIGILPPNLNDVLHGRRNVTKQLAMKLEEALGIPIQSWINLQSRYNYLIHNGVLHPLSTRVESQ